MKNKIIVKRYTDAFLKYCKEGVGIQKGIQDLLEIKSLMRQTPAFLEFMQAPEATFQEKCDFLDRVLQNGFSEEINHFLKLLLDKGRIGIFLDIVDYVRVNFSHGDEIEAVLKTSLPLETDLIGEIKGRLEDKFKKKFKLYIDLDGSLLGGIQVVIGNTVIDGSVRRRIEELREKLMTVRLN